MILKAEWIHLTETDTPAFLIEHDTAGVIIYEPHDLLWEAQSTHREGDTKQAMFYLGLAASLLPEMKGSPDLFKFNMEINRMFNTFIEDIAMESAR